MRKLTNNNSGWKRTSGVLAGLGTQCFSTHRLHYPGEKQHASQTRCGIEVTGKSDMSCCVV